MATIYDVGKHAAVPAATASPVINNTSYGSPELRKRVEEAVRELNYSPNLLARGLAIQKTQSPGVLVPDIASFFFQEAVHGAEDKAQKGKAINLVNSGNQLDKEGVHWKQFLSKRLNEILRLSTSTAKSQSC